MERVAPPTQNGPRVAAGQGPGAFPCPGSDRPDKTLVPSACSTGYSMRNRRPVVEPRAVTAGTSGSCSRLDQHLQDRYDLAVVSGAFNVRTRTMLRRFGEETRETPLNYLQRSRVRRARHLLESTDRSISSIAAQVGYHDASTFCPALRTSREALPPGLPPVVPARGDLSPRRACCGGPPGAEELAHLPGDDPGIGRKCERTRSAVAWSRRSAVACVSSRRSRTRQSVRPRPGPVPRTGG